MPDHAKRRPSHSRRLLSLAFVFCTLVIGGSVAAKPSDITESEMKLLPRYCPDTQGFGYGDQYSNTSPRAAYWVSLMGPAFWNMHHYCWAEINMNRSRKARLSSMTRRGLWDSARGDYGYVIQTSPPDFILLPEIYTKIGEVELLLDRPNKADAAFSRARKLKPDYWPAYSHWAEFLMQNKHRADAMEIVREGLKNAPRSKVLREQYRVLGGKTANLPNAN